MQEQQFKFIIDLSSIGVVATTLIGWLPPTAAIFTIIWTGIQIYDWWTKKRKS